MPSDFVKKGPIIYGYPADTYPPNLILGTQQIKPIMLDALATKLSDYAMDWTYVKFVRINNDQIPAQAGVYCFIVLPHAANIEHHSIVLYIGKAKTSLRDRYQSYIREREATEKQGRERVKQMLNIYKERVIFAYCCLDNYDVEKVEDLLLEAFNPCCNTAYSKFKPAF